jgi:histidinol-phosphate aminotransferase
MTLMADPFHFDSSYYLLPLKNSPEVIEQFEQYLETHLKELHRYPEEEYPNLIKNIAEALNYQTEQTFIAKSAPELLEFFMEPWASPEATLWIEGGHVFQEIIHQQAKLKGCKVLYNELGTPIPEGQAPTLAFTHTLNSLNQISQAFPNCPIACQDVSPKTETFTNPVAFYYQWSQATATANVLPPVFGWTNDPLWADTLKKIQEPFHIPTQLLALMQESLPSLQDLKTQPKLTISKPPSPEKAVGNILPDIAVIKPYVPGKGIKKMSKELGMPEEAFSKLASNEHPYGLDEHFLQDFKAYFSSWKTQTLFYSDLWTDTCTEILKFSGKPNWHPKQVSLGTGSVELIKAIIKSQVPEHGTVMSPVMPFAMYPFETQKRLAHYQTVPVTEAMQTDLNLLIEGIQQHRPQLIFLANPRNPLGTALPDLSPLIEALTPEQTLVMDEAYYDFIRMQMGPDVYPNGLDLIERYPNKKLISLRTFSKGLALASFRLGYALSSETLIQEMEATMIPCPVDPFSMAAALVAMRRPHLEAHIAEMVEEVLVAKKSFYDLFESLHLKYVPSYSNFIYFETGEKHSSQSLFDALVKQGVIIRPVLPHSARVNVGTDAQNQHFFQAMQKAYHA